MAVASGAVLPLVLIPGFAGLAWDTASFGPWHHRILVSGKLPDLPDLDAYARVIETWTLGLPRYVLIGDSFGALIAITIAGAKPSRLSALVLSGPFERQDLEWTRTPRLAAAGGERTFHAALEQSVAGKDRRRDSVAARHEAVQLIEAGCGSATFARRAGLALAFDAPKALDAVDVPVLVMRPANRGYFFRLVEPARYAATIEEFVELLDGGDGVAESPERDSSPR